LVPRDRNLLREFRVVLLHAFGGVMVFVDGFASSSIPLARISFRIAHGTDVGVGCVGRILRNAFVPLF
jgi:hypothetical protein